MSFKFSPRIVTNGLIFYVDAANTTSYISGSTVWNDLSMNKINGTLTSGPTFNSFGRGNIVFDGVDDYVETNNTITTSNASYSVGVWAKSSVAGVNNRTLGNADAVNGLTGMDIIWGYPASNNVYAVRRAGTNVGTFDTQITVNNLLTDWHYIFVTYNHTGVGTIMYADGAQSGTNTNLGFTCTLPFRIGRDGAGVTPFNGQVSMVHIYNRALTPQEVFQNYITTKSRFGL